MRVRHSRDYAADAERLWASAVDLGDLRTVCRGLVSFDDRVPATGRIHEGDIFVTDVRLFGRLPPRTYRMEVAELSDADRRFRSEESGAGVIRWTHVCTVTATPSGARLTDEIEIEAGAMTLPMALWARLLYRIRGRRRAALVEGPRLPPDPGPPR